MTADRTRWGHKRDREVTLAVQPGQQTAQRGSRSWLTHRCCLCKDVLAAQVGAGKGGHHGDNEVEDGDDNGFHRANWGHRGEGAGFR